MPRSFFSTVEKIEKHEGDNDAKGLTRTCTSDANDEGAKEENWKPKDNQFIAEIWELTLYKR